MPVSNPSPIQILDEGVSQGYVTKIDFVGSPIAASVAGITATITATAAAGLSTRVVATGTTLTIPNTDCYVVSSYVAVQGTGTLAIEGDADLTVL